MVMRLLKVERLKLNYMNKKQLKALTNVSAFNIYAVMR